MIEERLVFDNWSNGRFDQHLDMIRTNKQTWTLLTTMRIESRKNNSTNRSWDLTNKHAIWLRQESFVVCNYRVADGFIVDIMIDLQLDG
jgi:hypothetical protein